MSIVHSRIYECATLHYGVILYVLLHSIPRMGHLHHKACRQNNLRAVARHVCPERHTYDSVSLSAHCVSELRQMTRRTTAGRRIDEHVSPSGDCVSDLEQTKPRPIDVRNHTAGISTKITNRGFFLAKPRESAKRNSTIDVAVHAERLTPRERHRRVGGNPCAQSARDLSAGASGVC